MEALVSDLVGVSFGSTWLALKYPGVLALTFGER